MNSHIELRIFPFYDHSSIERHLESRARSGWRVDGVGALFHYHRAETSEVKYAVVYVEDSGFWMPPNESELSFEEFCEEAGWELVAEHHKLKVFCNENSNAVPLETEPQVQVNNIRMCSIKFVLDNILLMLGWLFLIAWNCLPYIRSHSLTAHPDAMLQGVIYLGFLLVSADALVTYARWVHRAEKNAKVREFTPTRSHYKFQTALYAALLCVYPVYSFFRSDGSWLSLVFTILGAVLILYPMTVQPMINFRLRKRGASGLVNWFLCNGVIAVAVVVSIIFIVKWIEVK